jgi:hypothetical protein
MAEGITGQTSSGATTKLKHWRGLHDIYIWNAAWVLGFEIVCS